MLTSVVSATLRILAFRAGPQDFPYSPSLTRLLVPFALVVNFALAATMGVPVTMAALSAAISVFGLSAATRGVLRMRKLENRYEQTFHALLATSSVMALLLIAPMSQLMPEILKVAQNPALLEQDPQALQLPAGPSLLVDIVMIWNFAVSARIYRQACDMKLLSGVAVALLVSMSLLLFVGFASSVIGSILGVLPAAP